MPATVNEAQQIIEIVTEYIPLDKAQTIFRRLYEEVGKNSDNYSLQVTLQMLAYPLSAVSDLDVDYKVEP